MRALVADGLYDAHAACLMRRVATELGVSWHALMRATDDALPMASSSAAEGRVSVQACRALLGLTENLDRLSLSRPVSSAGGSPSERPAAEGTSRRAARLTY
jgi:hypothetical protein